MTDNEFFCYLEGYQERKEEQLNNSRLIMWAILQKGNKKRLKPTDVFKLTIDDKRVKEIAESVNLEEYERKREQIKRIWSKMKKNTST